DIYNFASNLISITSIDAGVSIVNPTPTATATDTPTPTNTFDPSFTPSATATATDTPTPSDTPTPTDTITPSSTPTPTDTLDPSITPTATATATATETDVPVDIFTETPEGDEPTPDIFTETPEESSISFITDTPVFPTPPDTPRCDLRNFSPNDVMRAGVRPEFDLFCRTLVQWSEFVYYFDAAITSYANVGIEALIRLGIIQAVDIFSPSGQTYFEGGYVMCLAGEGTLIWLDATNAPRHADIIGSYTVPEFPGFTCATLFTPGTLVLVETVP
ncbi:MAG: hypothetical protein IT319_12415, partial [Anaerolineae bacterium]|nr:hypothetical protein [Anaerolineae bacterium]